MKLKNYLKKIKEKNKLEFNINDLFYPPIKRKTIDKLIPRADLKKKN